MIRIVLSFSLLLIFLLFKFLISRKSNKSVDVSKYFHKIAVNLEACEIVSGTIHQNSDRYINLTNPSGNTNSILKESYGIEYVTYITYLYDSFKFIAGPLDISEMAVRAACLEKKTAYIYYSRTDYSDYYFDVNFILS